MSQQNKWQNTDIRNISASVEILIRGPRVRTVQFCTLSGKRGYLFSCLMSLAF
jgi:hypothetical protein